MPSRRQLLIPGARQQLPKPAGINDPAGGLGRISSQQVEAASASLRSQVPVKLVLIRGLPGSGKSTLAQGMEGFNHFEADQYYVQDGEYRYDRTKIREAHAWCVARTREALERGESVVVSNTFTRQKDMKPYLEMATELGIPIRIREATGTWGNIHGVSEEVQKRMRKGWEPTPQGLLED